MSPGSIYLVQKQISGRFSGIRIISKTHTTEISMQHFSVNTFPFPTLIQQENKKSFVEYIVKQAKRGVNEHRLCIWPQLPLDSRETSAISMTFSTCSGLSSFCCLGQLPLWWQVAAYTHLFFFCVFIFSFYFHKTLFKLF